MDFRFTPEQEQFRGEVREFLRQELPAGWQGAAGYGEEGSDATPELGARLLPALAGRTGLAMAGAARGAGGGGHGREATGRAPRHPDSSGAQADGRVAVA